MKKIILVLPVLAATVFLSGCSLYGNSTQTSNSQPATDTTTPVSDNAIGIQNFAFSPVVLTVKKGTTVTWTNSDSTPHQIKSATFNSSQLSKGQSFSFTFDTAGSFNYICSIHPSMTGKIIVE